jgi:hypothetical protein
MTTTNMIQHLAHSTTMEKAFRLAAIDQHIKEIADRVNGIYYFLNEQPDGLDVDSRYMELYALWKSHFRGHPICKKIITDQTLKHIDSSGTKYNKELYRNVFQAAIYAGYALEAPAESGGDGEHYVLYPLDEDKPQPLQHSEDV